jgi:ferredoxin--NADP+ reductase
MASEPVRVAIVGAGPAGFYAAEALLAAENLEVDVFDRLATPWGLVRSGVAPDHPKIKSVTRRYEQTASHQRFRFFGNVEVGTTLQHSDLARLYHAVIYSSGASIGRDLGIPGEDLPGSVSATEFVAWYNGHPDATHLVFDLSHPRAIVVGNGNVALDVARMLMVREDLLRETDVADHALEVLSGHGVEEVILLGRRGPAQAAFTTPELRELESFTDATVLVEGGGALQTPEAAEGRVKRNLEVIRAYAENRRPASGRTIVLRFLASPLEIIGAEQVEAVRVGENELVERDGRISAVATGREELIEAGLVIRSVGYRGRAIPGVPFDEATATIPNDCGRVLDPQTQEPLPGLYTAGWVKRGPSGIIGTNKRDANETVASLLQDLAAGRLPAPVGERDGLGELLHGHRVVDLAGWRRIDRVERERGEREGRPRVKLVRAEDLLEHAAGAGREGE